MTWPPIIRVFFAIEFDDILQQNLKKIISTIKKKTRLGLIRWTKPHQLHVTLKFIPTLYTSELPQLETKITNLVKKYPKTMSLNIGNCTGFPHFFHPRVIVMEILPKEYLMPIVEDLNSICDSLPLAKPEEKPFRPHVTLGRVKFPKEICFPEWLTFNTDDLPSLQVDHITLFRSEPEEEGSNYTVIKRFPLG